MQLKIELEREADGRWIAEIPSMPGTLVYGSTKEVALRTSRVLALRVIADQIEHEGLDDLVFEFEAA